MIEINLLPGTGKKRSARGGGAKFDVRAAFAGLIANVKDKYLAAAFMFLTLGGGAVGASSTFPTKVEADLTTRLDQAVQDSTHYAAVMRDKARATAKRDTVLRQLNIIKAIDEDRYIWPHILDEVSKALPPYTWLTVINFSGSPQGVQSAIPGVPNQVRAPATPAADSTAKKVVTDIPRDTVRVRVLGRTVDIQALTRFMKQLEASPFLGDVQLQKSELAIDDKKEVTQFTLDVTYTRPDASIVQRVPLTASVR